MIDRFWRGLRVVALLTMCVGALVVAAPAAVAASSKFPPLVLSTHVVDGTGTVNIAGTGCFGSSGLGTGVFVEIRNGQLTFHPEPTVNGDGTWTAQVNFDVGTIPGAWSVYAACFDYSASGDPYPPDTIIVTPGSNPQLSGPLTVSATTVHPGDVITISGAGFSDVANVAAFVYSSPAYLGSVTPDVGALGAFSMQITIPLTLSPGTHTVVAAGHDDGQGGGGIRLLGTAIIVTTTASQSTATTVASSGSDLARTGSNTRSLGVFGTTLFVGGSFLVLAGVERRARSARHRISRR
jgi:hypothetical protein